MATVRGAILAAIDTPVDNIESWNRWYDLEHLPPNIALDDIAHGRRYVAPPRLHEARMAEADSPWANGHAVNVTLYWTLGDPGAAIGDMTETREVLVEAGRMDNAGERTVRAGDALDLVAATGDPALRLDERDVPWVSHSGLRIVHRSGGVNPAGMASVRAAAVAVAGCHGVVTMRSRFVDGVEVDLYFLEGDPATVTSLLRTDAPYPTAAALTLDAPFQAIVPFDYSFASEFR